MKKCSKCGSRFPDGYKFCSECGAKAPEYPTFGGRTAYVAKGIVFVLLFTIIQYVVSFAYAMYATAAVMTPELLSEGEDAFNKAVMELIEKNTSALSIAIYIITVIVLFIIFAAKKRKFTDSVGINSFRPAAIPLALLAGLALNYFVTCAMAITPVPESMIEKYDEIYSFMGQGNIYVEFISVAVFAPIVEEIVFRGLCYRYARKAFPPIVAALISGVIFGISHGNIISFVFTTLLGIILAYAYEKSGSIIPSILIHIGFNAGSYTMNYTLPAEPTVLHILIVLAVSIPLSIMLCALLFKFSKKASKAATPETVDDYVINGDAPFIGTDREENKQ